MARRIDARAVRFVARGLSDAVDGAIAFDGAMASLSNLILDTKSKYYVCRPASTLQTNFGSFTNPAGITALFTLGTRIYGMISSGHFAGKDEPFCWDTVAQAFVAITGTAAGNLPATQLTSGDWQPPGMAMVGQRILLTHPGFAGGSGPFFGWIDVSGFTSNTITGTTVNTSKTITTLSANPITAGWQPGMTISDAHGDIPANTTIVSMTTNTVTISNAMTNGHAANTLTVAGGTAAAPQWGAGNVNQNPLVAVPAAVAQYNGRAWYAVGNSLVFSDALNPTQVSNATAVQVLTAGSNLSFTALGGLPLNNLTGGVVQSLFAFQGDVSVYQITGDQATQNLALNQLAGRVGTISPASVVSTPLGLMFIAPDGLRYVDLNGRVSSPVGSRGQGVAAPFISAQYPTRTVAAYNQNTLRISCNNALVSGIPRQEYWLDLDSLTWSGPHTFPADAIVAIDSPIGFAFQPTGVTPALFTHSTLPGTASTYTENGTALSYSWAQPLQPDDDMSEGQIIDSQVMLGLDTNFPLTITATDDQNNQLNQVILNATLGSGSQWGAFLWGQGKWGATATLMYTWKIPWSAPLVFKQMKLSLTGQSSPNLTIGVVTHRVRKLNYVRQ